MAISRVTGSSGFDVDSAVKSLMKAQRIPLDKIKQNSQILQWQRDDYRTLNNKILDFRNSAFNMKLQSPYLAKTASSTDETTISAKGTADAVAGNYTIKVTQLATAASVNSGVVGASTLGTATTMSTLGFVNPLGTALTISGEKGSATVTINPTDTIGSFLTTLNGQASKTGVKAGYDSTLDRFFLMSTNTGSTAKVDLKSTDATLLGTALKFTTSSANIATVTSSKTYDIGSATLINGTLTAPQKLTVAYNGKTSVLTVDNTTTINQLISNLNSSEVGQQGVSAYLDSTNHLVILNPNTGLGSISFTDTDGDTHNVLNDVGINPAGVSPVTPVAGTYNKVAAPGVDALVSFNGLPATAYKSNNFTINGIQFTAKKAQNIADLPINVVVGQDVDSTFNSIKALIDKYNDTIDTVNKKISEERLRDYQPLTDDQRTNLTADQIKTWEDKAKSGLLHNDPLMMSSLSNFRLQLSQPLTGIPSGNLKQLSDIGISTGNYQDKGKLVINEATLRQAISNKPEQVMNLFNSKDDTTSSNAHGIAVRMYDIADQAYKQISAKAGTSLSVSSQFTIGKSINNLNTRIDSFNKRLTVIENRYYKQFSAMESATNKFNAQSASLAKALGQ